jgi:hypothetical protein
MPKVRSSRKRSVSGRPLLVCDIDGHAHVIRALPPSRRAGGASTSLEHAEGALRVRDHGGRPRKFAPG